MRRLCVCAVALLAGAAQAQDTMTVQAPASTPGFYTTRDAVPPAAPAAPAPGSLPWLQNEQRKLPPGYKPSVPGAGDIPFQRSTPYGSQAVPAPLPMNQAVPTETIDGIEVTEPAAPAQAPVGADPVSEDPAAPTELTSPLFSTDIDDKTPRTMKLRVLNKVTARAQTLTAKPGETLSFGKLTIEARQCYRSVPSSLSDSVALLAIYEQTPERKEPKLLFQGWMYASSPSITALEHPIYDVTMVDCTMRDQAPADAVKTEEKPKKKAD